MIYILSPHFTTIFKCETHIKYWNLFEVLPLISYVNLQVIGHVAGSSLTIYVYITTHVTEFESSVVYLPAVLLRINPF
jgi:hypothetical protein